MQASSARPAVKIVWVTILCFATVAAISWAARGVDGPLWFASVLLRGLVVFGNVYWVVKRLPNPFAMGNSARESNRR